MTTPFAPAPVELATSLEDAVALRFLFRPVAFMEPDRVVPPASWLDYTPFAFWVVDALRPSLFVELGCHSGNSYASFAQAVQSLGLSTACYAVDSWLGDAHAGFFEESVFEEWSTYHNRRFSGFSTLIRSTFDEASGGFTAATIDLLHLDGYHTFEAAAHDFETWRSKLSERGVVLCHDTNVRERDFGVWRLWERLREEYPSFEFLHGHGLGVLGIGRDLPEPIRWLLSLRTDKPELVDTVRRFFARLGAAVVARHSAAQAEQQLRGELDASNVHRARAEADVARLSDEVSESRQQLDTVNAEVERLAREAADASARAGDSEARASKIRDALTRATQELARRASERERLADSLRTCQAELDRKATHLERFASKIAGLSARVGLLAHELDARTADVVRLQRDRDRFPEALAAREAAIAALDTEAATAIEQLHCARAQPRGRARKAGPRIDAYDPSRIRLSATSLAPDSPVRPTVVVVSHVGAWQPRAGNEYRIHRMLRWFRSRSYRVIPVFAPLPGDELPFEAIEGIAAEVGNAIQCRRDGRIEYLLSDAPDAVRLLEGTFTSSFAALLGEESPASSARQRRLLQIERTFCHDVVASTIVQLARALGPHVLQVEYIWMTRVFPLIGGHVLKVVDTHDVLSSVADKVRMFGVADVAIDADDEAERLRRADLAVAIQENERLALQRLAPTVPVITAGVDFDVAKDIGPPVSGQILYVGSDNARNRQGLNDFLRLAWPRIRREVPHAELIVAGRAGDMLVDRDVPGVTALGRVDDLAARYRDAALVINPAAAGTGLKIKVVEALCHFRPVVTWPAGVDGLQTGLAELCYVAHDWYEFAGKVVGALSARETAFTSAARLCIAQQVDPASVYREVDAKYRKFFHRHAGRPEIHAAH